MSDLLLFPSAPLARPALPLSPREDLSDGEAREAALDIQRSWIVEAPAGSGKTGLLIQRFLKLLAYGEVHHPGEVLVLTFTRKADGELRSRILDQLTAAAEGHRLPPDAGAFEQRTREFAQAVLARDQGLGWQLLNSPAQLNIRTIDSFCAELASSMPLLAGGGRLRPIDDAAPLYLHAAEGTLAQLGGPDPVLHDALRLLLEHRDAQVADCLRLLTNMLAQREQWSELIPLDAPTLTDEYLDTVVRQRLNQTLERIVTNGLQRAATALGPDDLRELASFAARLSWQSGYKDEPNPLAPCATLRDTVPTEGDFLTQWNLILNLVLKKDGDWRRKPRAVDLKCDIDKQDLQWLEQFVAHLEHRGADLHHALRAIRDLPPAQYPEESWPLIKALCRILSHALAELRTVFAARAQCDFTEIALAARALLRPDPASGGFTPDLSATPAGSLTHLLIDEMQDTSSGQYQMLESLTEFWDGASQTVFLVGDPKQSIYAFRQARVERFLRTMATGRLGELPLSPLRLTANFRSQASLVASYNATFPRIFSTPTQENPEDQTPAFSQDADSIPFVAATAVRPATLGLALHWHALLKPAQATSQPQNADTAQDQARQIRDRIDSFRASWPDRCQAAGIATRPPKIAVLARNRAHLAPILTEFKLDRGNGPLPFRAVDVEALNERPEVLDLLALTRALLHPTDRVAWLAVLRSPVCGLTLADLLALTGEGPGADPAATVPHLVATRGEYLSPQGQQLLARAWPTLVQALSILGATDLSTHVERTWRSLGGDAPLAPGQRRNADRFLDLLRKVETSGEALSHSTLKHHLQKLYAEPAAADNAVELMTIHKAKGLEWDLVLVPSLDRGSGRNHHGLLKWLELDNPDTEADLLLAPIQSKGTEISPLSRWLNRGETRREAAEAQRLFYVACTRAREELHLFAAVETKADGSFCKPGASSSLLAAAWPAARPIFEQQLRPLPDNIIPFAASPREHQPLALAAAGEDDAPPGFLGEPAAKSSHHLLQRLPSDFDPATRFARQALPGLSYPAPEALRRSAVFARPEGSFAARAFGNTLHRFLQLLATRLAEGELLEALQNQVPSWLPRLSTTLRNEGLPSNLAVSEAHRAADALHATLRDPEGAWILAAHPGARSESNLNLTSVSYVLRADRTFLAGSSPLQSDEATHLWIVDYKTAELGGRTREAFFANQQVKYLPQMQAYAAAATRAGTPAHRIMLALYFPLLPALLSWPAEHTLTP